MELMQLEMFVAMIEERSVQKAAERVSRTQPAVSIALRKLEDHVGIALLDRSRRRGYRLTQAGELLYEFASSMVAMRNEVLSTLRGKTNGCTGRLSIGASGAASLRRVQALATTFCERHPRVRVETVSDQPEKLLRDVVDRKIDAAFLSGHPTADGLKGGAVLGALRILKLDEALWLALPRRGRSHTLRMFEEVVFCGWSIPAETIRRARPLARKAG
jgi:DNA-binding transcriptional LysR family regulator